MLKNDSFTIISNDCWGGEVYRNLGLAYLTPFVGLYVMAPCYIKMLEDLKSYMHAELEFLKRPRSINARYPVGLLNGDVEIHFLHYDSEDDAAQTWNNRKQRINWDNLFVKFDYGKDGSTYELVQKFNALPYKNKLCLTNEELPDIPCSVYFEDYVANGVNMYLVSLKKINVTSWLNGDNWKVTG